MAMVPCALNNVFAVGTDMACLACSYNFSMMSLGVPAGASRPSQNVKSIFGKPPQPLWEYRVAGKCVAWALPRELEFSSANLRNAGQGVE